MGQKTGKFKSEKETSSIPPASNGGGTSSERALVPTGNQVHAIPALSEEDYGYLMTNTGKSRSEIRSLFNKFARKSTDGELNYQQFCDFYLSISPDPPQYLKDNSQFIFDTFDQDQNGRVSFKEFLVAYALLSSGNLEKKIEYTFHLYDLDQNGYLDLDEVYRIVTRIFSLLNKSNHNESLSIRFAQDVVKKLDVNPRDGKISKEEYVVGLTNDPNLRILLTPFD